MKIFNLLALGLLFAPGASLFANPLGDDATVLAKGRVQQLNDSNASVAAPGQLYKFSATDFTLTALQTRALEITLSANQYPPLPNVLGWSLGQTADFGEPLTLSWEQLDNGTEDVYVFLQIASDDGAVVFTTPGLLDSRVLRGSAYSATISAGTLMKDQTYGARLIFFRKAETVTLNGRPVAIGYFSETDFSISTKAAGSTQRTALASVAALPGTFQIKPSTYTVTEAAKTANVVISRTGGTAAGASVSFETVSGSALAGLDFVATNGTIVFAAGQATQMIPIPIIDDTLAEGDETFQLRLVSVGGGAGLSTNRSATITIKDNDVGGQLAFAAATYRTNESAGTAVITVKRTGGFASGVSIDYWTENGTAVGNTDYTPARGTLVFGSRVSAMTFAVPIIDNAVVGPGSDKTILLHLGNPKGGGQAGAVTNAVLTIADDDSAVGFTNSSVTATEGKPLTLTIVRSGVLTTPGTVQIATLSGSATAGSDFVGTNLTITFPPKIASQTISLSILNDSVKDQGETFRVILKNPTGGVRLGAITNAIITINDAPDPNGVPQAGAPFVKFSVNGTPFVSGAKYIVGSYETTSHFLVVSGTQMATGLGGKTHMMLIQNLVVSAPGTYQVPTPTFGAISYQRTTVSMTPTTPDFFTTLDNHGSGTMIIDVLDLNALIVTGRFDFNLNNTTGPGTVHVVGSFRVPFKKSP